MNEPFDGDDLPAFRATEAIREAVPALIALWGFSDSGKTYSALRLARGLVGVSLAAAVELSAPYRRRLPSLAIVVATVVATLAVRVPLLVTMAIGVPLSIAIAVRERP